MRPIRLVSVLLLFLSGPARASAQDTQLGLRVPPGFEVTEFADSRLANDIFSLALDPRGRVVVSGRGYIRILVDDDHDGRADRALDFADGPKDGAMGMLWEGSALYVTGDGGLRRYRDADGDDRADGPSELIRALRTGGEHHAHAIRRGPDGWLYVLCGNQTGVDQSFARRATSPIRQPVAGCVLRFTPDLKDCEIVADGFRNAYDMDFNPDGELFTYDSDNERCVSLPWYEPTRFYHVIPVGHYGWQSPHRAQWWRLPPYYGDVVAPLAYLGRGSPTGVACYRHTQFPEPYRGGMFLLDWTFGRVYFLTLKRSGATYVSDQQVFLEAVGDNGFAPTDVVVHPATGDLFLAIGGRGTRGAVYRVRYPRGVGRADPAELARLQVKPRSLDWHPALRTELVKQAAGEDALDRLRALADIRRHRTHFEAQAVHAVVRANWGHPDRYVRKATADLLSSLDREDQQALAKHLRTPLAEATYGLGSYPADPSGALARATRNLVAPDASPDWRLANVRLLQKALGGLMAAAVKGTVWEGYTPALVNLDPDQADRARAALRAVFPTGHVELDRELARTLAVLEDEDAGTLGKVADRITATSDPVEDIHYLLVLARLRAGRPAALTGRVAAALLALDDKLTRARLNRDRNWPLRMAELHSELARKDPALHAALLAHADFGRPDHALFAQAPGFDRRRAAEVFLARAEKDADFPWSPALIELVGSLPEERSLPVLRGLWDKAGLEESLLPLLARNPQPADQDKFLAGLSSPQLATMGLCVQALEKLPPRSDGADVLALIRALRRLAEGREEKALRERLGRHLRRLTGQEHLGADRQKWTGWFTKTYPDLAARLGGSDGVDVAAWTRRLAALDWSAGDAERGQGVFTKASCATCHSGAQALGPDLRGVTGRFSRDDLFTAILQPSRDISPRYQTTLIATADDKLYQGAVIYEAVDSLILQTGPATTIRLTNSQITARRPTETSLMPAGLLDQLSDRDIADLYAYLRTLGHSPQNRRRRVSGPRSRSPSSEGTPCRVGGW
jgi:putative membrane-bound dehydrogenase-like protein